MNTDTAQTIIDELISYGTPEQAINLSRFFKTGKGQYGEGDKFLGIKVPITTASAKRWFKKVSFEDLEALISSEYHESRMFALLALQMQYFAWKKEAKKKPAKNNPSLLIQSAAAQNMKRCIDFYLSHTKYINNWDLVDLTCTKMLADWMMEGNTLSRTTMLPDRKLLYRFVDSPSMWENRIAIVTCIGFTREGDCDDAIAIAEKLLGHKEDLLHKAVGWTLREVGKHDQAKLDAFLEAHAGEMPRTALRYAIEHYPQEQRKEWLKH